MRIQISRHAPFTLRLAWSLVVFFAVQGVSFRTSYAVDLNAPAQKFIPTIKSEIQRGDSTIFVDSKQPVDDVLGFVDGVSRVLNSERRSGNDTDVFIWVPTSPHGSI
jgi:hypothetical protein